MIFLPTKQYQAVHISFYFIDKIETDAFLYRFLLARILTSYTQSYMSKQSLSKKLNALYGMFITNHIFILKDYHIMRFNFVFPNPNLVGSPEIMDDIINIIKEMFFDRPLFKEDIFEEARRYTIAHIQSKKDHKLSYAKDRLMHHMFLNHPYGMPITGSLEEVYQVTLTETYDYYQKYFLNNQLQIYVCGELDDDLKNKLSIFESYEKTIKIPPLEHYNMHRKIQTIDEHMNMHQTYIFLAYHLPVKRDDKRYVAALLAHTLIAGYPESLMYKTLRETYFMAYDVDSTFEYDKSVLILYAGVNIESASKAYHLMIETMNNFIFDGPSITSLNQAKDYLKNEILSSLDFQDSIIPQRFIADLFQLNDVPTDLIDQINAVTLEDMLEVISMLKLDTTYVLNGDTTYEI